MPAVLSRLWVRNLAAAVLAVTALAASTGINVLDRASYRKYADSRFPAHTIGHGQTAQIDGQEWKLGSVREFGKAPTARRPAPKGSEILVVQIIRKGTPSNSELCTAYLIQDDRRWKAENAFGGDYWVRPPDDGTSQECKKPGSLQFSFLVPVDADPTSIDILGPKDAIRVRLKL